MSSALLKKSLEMFKDDLVDKTASAAKKKKKGGDPMKRISTKRKGVRKELRRVKQQQEAARQLQLTTKRARTAEDDVADMAEQDFTQQNILHIQKLSALSKTNKYITTQLLSSHRGKLSKNRVIEEKQKEEPKSILFDDP